MKYILIKIIELYQHTLSPDHGWLKGLYPAGYCRFTPSCSDYSKEAIMKNWEEYGWAILSEYGLYTGWWFTRSDAIKSHTETLGRTWEQCKSNGDKAIKIIIYQIKEIQNVQS